MATFILNLIISIVATTISLTQSRHHYDTKKVNGVLQDSTGPAINLTCTTGTGGQCTFTVSLPGSMGHYGIGSRTTSIPNLTSSITDANGIKVKTISTENGNIVNNINTSVSPD